MNKRQFVEQRKRAWARFQALTARLDRLSSKADGGEVVEFSRLFRELSNDLSMVRTRGWRALAAYLNDLVAAGHSTFYRAPPGNVRAVLQFVAFGFPRLFRANVGYFIVAAMLFFGPLAVSWAVIQNHPPLAARILPNEMLEQFDSMYGKKKGSDHQQSDDASFGGYGEQRALMAGFYVQHNVGIAFSCFARGILLGVGTVYTLLFNGLMIGAVSGYVVSQGNAERFLSFVITHGAFELTAIAMAGAGGLMLGNALVHPGQRTRFEALAARGLEAVQIAGGAGIMLVVAALIEAFWSPAPIPAVIKYSVGGTLWLLVFLYLMLAGRKP